MTGAWFLEAAVFDTMENRLDSARGIKRQQLVATDETTAYAEAEKYWERWSAKTWKGWDDVTYPHTPRLVYERHLIPRCCGATMFAQAAMHGPVWRCGLCGKYTDATVPA